MKLHLPYSLRTALLALLSIPALGVTYAGNGSWNTPITSDNNPVSLQNRDEVWISDAYEDGIHLKFGDVLDISNNSHVHVVNCRGAGIYNDGGYINVRNTNDYTGGASVRFAENLIGIDNESGDISLTGNWFTFIDSNRAGGIVMKGGSVTLSDNYNSIKFENNRNTTSEYSGGAISCTGGTMTISQNSKVVFNCNSVIRSENASGGAIDCSSRFKLDNNGDVSFTENRAESSLGDAFGGAFNNNRQTLYFSKNGGIRFYRNVSSGENAYGGAIHSDERLDFENNGSFDFKGNSVKGDNAAYGGAIHTTGDMRFENNQCLTFSGNSAFSWSGAYGGAISSKDACLRISNNSEIRFEKNEAEGGCSCGGAVSNEGQLIIEGNGRVVFCDNVATYSGFGGSVGGAISSTNYASISNNGDISFFRNKACDDDPRSMCIGDAMGGAIENIGGTFIIAENGDIEFFENQGEKFGGAIYNTGVFILEGNGDVVFRGNMDSLQISAGFDEHENTQYYTSLRKLGSLYSAGAGSRIVLSASPNKTITFYDSIRTSNETTVDLNKMEKTSTEATGSIVFTGETIEGDLSMILLYQDAPTQKEIDASRTSVIGKAATLHGGSLVVKENAVLKAAGLTVKTSAVTPGGTKLVLQNGTLESNVTMQNGTTLQVSGHSSLTGTLTMQSGSGLDFKLDKNVDTPLTLTGTLVQKGKLTINIQGTKIGEFVLMTTSKKFGRSVKFSG